MDDQEPGFTVHFALVPAAAPEAEQLLAFAAAHMTTVGGGLGTFVLSDLNRWVRRRMGDSGMADG